MNLILVAPDELDAGQRVVLTDHRARHIREVLRKSRGDTVRVGVLNGRLGTAALLETNEQQVRLACIWSGAIPDPPQVDLLLALPRPKVLKRLWAQLAAIGVRRIILTNAAKVERCYFDSHVIDPAFYTPLLIEGLQQAGDTHIPQVHVFRRFRPLIEDHLDSLCPMARRIVLDPGAMAPLRVEKTDEPLLLAIGPEGGWTPFEVSLLEKHRFLPTRLPLRTVRSDTACIAALTLAHAHALRGD